MLEISRKELSRNASIEHFKENFYLNLLNLNVTHPCETLTGLVTGQVYFETNSCVLTNFLNWLCYVFEIAIINDAFSAEFSTASK